MHEKLSVEIVNRRVNSDFLVYTWRALR